MTAPDPTLDAVLESYLLVAHEDSALAGYLKRFPQFALDLVDLSHETQRMLEDDPRPLDPTALASIQAMADAAVAGWPADGRARNLFAELRPADYGRVANAMGVPRGVIGGIKDGLALWASIPGRWLGRLAEALGGTVDELRDSIGTSRAQASFKSEARPETKEPVTFEQLLVEARVDPARIAQIMEEDD